MDGPLMRGLTQATGEIAAVPQPELGRGGMRCRGIGVTCVGWLLVVLVLLLMPPSPAAGHPMVIYRGSMDWKGDDLTVSLLVEEQNLPHERIVSTRDITRRDMARMLGSAIEFTLADGSKLSPSDVAPAADGASVVTTYELTDSTDVLALQLCRDCLPQLPRQIQLSVRGGEQGIAPAAGPANARMLRLTSGGNYEILRRQGHAASHRQPQAANQPKPADRSFDDALVEPHLSIATTDDDSQVSIIAAFPATFFARFPGHLTVSDGTLSGRSFAADRARIETWLRRSLQISSPGETLSDYELQRVELVGPSGGVVGDADQQPCAAPLCLVRIALRQPVAGEATLTRITWGAFNPAVRRLPVSYQHEHQIVFQGALTSLQRSLMLHAPQYGSAMLLRESLNRPHRRVPIRHARNGGKPAARCQDLAVPPNPARASTDAAAGSGANREVDRPKERDGVS